MSLYQVVVTNLYGQDDNIITLQEDGDGLGMLHVSVKGEYYGKMDFSMDPDDAVEFANSILKQVKHIKENSK